MDNHTSIVAEAEIFHVKKYLSAADTKRLFNLLNDESKFRIHNLYWWNANTKQIDIKPSWRKSFWYGEYAQAVQSPDAFVESDGKIIHIPTDYVDAYPFDPEILDLKRKIESDFDIKFNSCLVGKFDGPSNKIGFHSDASTNLGDDPYIGSVSFGKSRKFVLKRQKKYCTNDTAEKVTITLDHGDLLLMRRDANRKYLRMVPPDPDCSSNNCRINLTFRNYAYSPEEIAYTTNK